MIKDSGTRREFDTGAVRDIQEGKGRCDLLPLAVIGEIYETENDRDGTGAVLSHIADFQQTGRIKHLHFALVNFMQIHDEWDAWSTLFLEVAKHFEEGCQKYGENNWQKGIPTKHYVDSMARHYLKWLRGDKDEAHDKAFCWNVLCCMWTAVMKPELNTYGKGSVENDND